MDLLSAFVLLNTAKSTNIPRRRQSGDQQATGYWLAGSALA